MSVTPKGYVEQPYAKRITLVQQGGLLQHHQPSPGRKGGGIRGKVNGFTDDSRRRLMMTFAALDWLQMAAQGIPITFLTLTTPEPFWRQERAVYAALDKFRRWLSARPGYKFAVVRKERGAKRGMLHYHLIVFGAFLPEERGNKGPTSEVWTRFLASSVPVRVDVERTENAEVVSKYLSKYCSKAGYDGAERTGGDAGGCPRSHGPQPPDGDVPLSKAHNAESGGEGDHNGSRWWYVWGEKVIGEETSLETESGLEGDIKKLAARVRRIFRRWRKQAIYRAIRRKMVLQYGEDMAAHINYDAWVKSQMKRERWLRSSGGWSIMASPALLELCLSAADYAGA